MNVLHVIPSLGPLRGGPSMAAMSMARGLAKAGLKVDIATTNDNGPGLLNVPLNQVMVDDGVSIHYFQRQTRFYTASLPLTTWLRRHLHKYDMLHIHALFSYPSVVAALLAARQRVPYILRPLGILNRWGMENRRRFLKKLSYQVIEKRILSGASAIHYTSEAEKQEAHELGISGNAAVIPLGINRAEFSHLPGPEQLYQKYPEIQGRSILLYMSRIDLKKGLDILLPAFRDIHDLHPDTILLIAGNGETSYIGALRNIAQNLQITQDIVWTGFLSGYEKLAALAAASIYVLPSYSENFGIAPIEAAAAGLPVVVSDQVAIAQEVGQYHAGAVVPCQKEALVAAIDHLLTHPLEQKENGLNGIRMVDERFSQEAMTERLIELYTACLNGRGGTLQQ